MLENVRGSKSEANEEIDEERKRVIERPRDHH